MTQHPQIQELKTAHKCVFCNKTMKKGVEAVSHSGLYDSPFEHTECSESRLGFIGDQGFLERTSSGIPRCHLCGWYQDRLDLHIDSAHSLTENDYREAFELSESDLLISFAEEDSRNKQEYVEPEDEPLKLFPDENLERKAFVGRPASREVTKEWLAVKKQKNNREELSNKALKRQNPRNKKKKNKRTYKQRREEGLL